MEEFAFIKFVSCPDNNNNNNNNNTVSTVLGARGGIVVKALRYKPAGRGFDSRWCHWNFSVT
jgi:hypothetical protein